MFRKINYWIIILFLSIAIPLIVVLLMFMPEKVSLNGNWLLTLPHVNGIINSITALVLIFGFIMIKGKKVDMHRKAMTSAFILGILFLISYLIYHSTSESRVFVDLDGNKNLLPEMARAVGLEVENVHAPFDKTNRIWTESVNAEDIVKRYTQCIIDCAQHNIPTVVVHLTNGDAPPPPTLLGLDRIKYLVELAEQKGVNIALENLRKPEYLQFVFSNIQYLPLNIQKWS